MHFCTMHVIMGLGLGWGCNDVVMWCKTCCDLTPEMGLSSLGHLASERWQTPAEKSQETGLARQFHRGCSVRDVLSCRSRYFWLSGIYEYVYIYIYVYKNQCTCPSMQGMCLCLVYHVCNTILTYSWLPCIFFSLFCTWTCKTHCE